MFGPPTAVQPPLPEYRCSARDGGPAQQSGADQVDDPAENGLDPRHHAQPGRDIDHPPGPAQDTTLAPVLTANDFVCFMTKFAAGCP